MKTHIDYFTKNSELSIELSKYILEHPEIDDLIKDDSVVIFLPEYDAELRDFNLEMAKEMEREGEKVIYIKVKQIGPKVTSRLRGVEIGA